METSTAIPQSFEDFVLARDPKVGDTQLSVLKSLCEHGGWGPGRAWVWSNRSVTIRLCESLVKRGLATKEAPISLKGMGYYRAVDWAQAYWNERKTVMEAARRARVVRENEEAEARDRVRLAEKNAMAELLANHADEFSTLRAKHLDVLETTRRNAEATEGNV